jgi:glycerophosphoryl diester phosphodiesterase
MEVIAHHRSPRPAGREAVRALLQRALESGADRVEIDVLPSPIGLVMAHDHGVLRGVEGLGMTDTLELISEHPAMPVLADIKHPGVGRELGEHLAALDLGARTIVCGELAASIEAAQISGAQVGWTMPVRPDAAPGPWGMATRRAKQRLRTAAAAALQSGRCDALCVDRRFVDAALVEAARDAGGKLFAWTADRERDLRRLTDLGVDGVITNEPTLAQRIRAAAAC